MILPQCYTIRATELSALRQNMKAVFRRLTSKNVIIGLWSVFRLVPVYAQKINQSRLAIDLMKAAKLHKSFTPNPRTPKFKKAYTAGGGSRAVRGCFAHFTWLARAIQNQSTQPQP